MQHVIEGRYPRKIMPYTPNNFAPRTEHKHVRAAFMTNIYEYLLLSNLLLKYIVIYSREMLVMGRRLMHARYEPVPLMEVFAKKLYINAEMLSRAFTI